LIPRSGLNKRLNVCATTEISFVPKKILSAPHHVAGWSAFNNINQTGQSIFCSYVRIVIKPPYKLRIYPLEHAAHHWTFIYIAWCTAQEVNISRGQPRLKQLLCLFANCIHPYDQPIL